jgi:hypothetical protein
MALEAIVPNYHSISDFRKDNPIAFKKAIQTICSLLKDADLIGKTIAISISK